MLWSGVSVLLAILLLVLAVRLALPEVDRFRPDIEARLSEILAQPVRIGQIEADWHVGPWLRLRGVRVGEATDPQIYLPRADLELHPLPLLWGRFAVRHLYLDRPYLALERLADGRLKIGGKVLGGKGDDLSVTLDHADMDIRGGTLDWRDAHHPGIGRLRLQQVRLAVKSAYRQHINVNMRLPQALGRDIRIELAAKDIFSDPLKSWGEGKVAIRALHTDLLAAYFNEALPFSIGGTASGTLAFAWGKGWVTRIQGPIRVSQPRLYWPAYYDQPLEARALALDLDWRARSGEGQLDLQQVRVERTAEKWRPFNLSLRNNLDDQPTRLDLQVDHMAVAPTLKLLPIKLLPPAWQRYLHEAHPAGEVSDFRLLWHAETPRQPERFTVSTRFAGLRTHPVAKNPGFRNLTGELKLDNNSGELNLDSRGLVLDWPYAFHQPIPIQKFRTQANWHFDGQQLTMDLPHFSLVGDFRAQGHARIVQTPGQRPYVDLTAQAEGGNAHAASRYYPYRIMSPKLQNWLDGALQDGRLGHTELRLRGPLSKFPFAKSRDGIFRVKSQFRDVTLRYLPGWPVAQQLRGDLIFDRQKMTIQTRQGRILDAQLAHLSASIPNLDHHPVLHLDTRINTSFNTGLRFLRASPILGNSSLGREDISATGMSPLDLKLKVALGRDSKTQVDGKLDLQAVNLRWDDWQVDKVSGPVNFSRDHIQAANLSGEWLGGPVNFDLRASPLQHEPKIEIDARGEASAQALQAQLKQDWLRFASGAFPYTFRFDLQQEQGHYSLDSPLTGLALALPYPLHKAAAQRRDLHAEGDFTIKRSLRIAAKLGQQQATQLLLDYQPQGWQPVRGAWQLGSAQPPALPSQGFRLQGQGDRLPLSEWISALGATGPASARTEAGKDISTPQPRIAIDACWDQVQFLDRNWPKVQVNGLYNAEDERLNLQLQSPQFAGSLQYTQGGTQADALDLKLTRLYVPPAVPGGMAAQPTTDVLQLPAKDSMPLQVQAEIADLRWENYQIDRLGLWAERRPGSWQVPRLELVQGAARFMGEAAWSGAGAGSTQISGEFQSDDLVGTLRKFALNTGLSSGSGQFTGTLRWPGSPLALDAGQLSGDLHMLLREGRFSGVSPVVKLLSLVNITSMFQRIFTMDFRDLLGKGLFFEEIKGEFHMNQGLAQARRIELHSSAMHVRAQGEINLRDQLLDLDLQVEPLQTVDLLVGRFPVLGRALFGQEGAVVRLHYEATGPWNDPRISLVSPTRSTSQP
ncbi:YhdP family protein [Thermithiobacillus plumbiphilus]|uniref:YhdP family protein n=1 Tax=Thermithiobacillus plumbiphilus TaxID=1729899 RepID=A0ABU9DBE1_9PROT